MKNLKFKFKHITVAPDERASGSHVKQLRGTPYARLWKMLLKYMQQGYVVDYQEYYIKKNVKIIQRASPRKIKTELQSVLVCRGSIK